MWVILKGAVIAQWYGMDDRGFESQQGMGVYRFTTASRPALGPIQPPIQWALGAFSLRVKGTGREADHSPPSKCRGQECVELYIHSPIRLHGMVLS